VGVLGGRSRRRGLTLSSSTKKSQLSKLVEEECIFLVFLNGKR